MNFNFSLLFPSFLAKELLATNFLVYFLHEAEENGEYWLTETYKKKLSDIEIKQTTNS